MLWPLCKRPQYQTFKIDRKFIHLFLQHKSTWILFLKQQKEQWRAMWVTIVVELVPVGYIFLVQKKYFFTIIKKVKWRKEQ
jgi:hypothetical protein